ncbi:hypothetical protein WT90_33330 [Burkholderia stagnalis]|nr:hypothetical protein WT90_33330 [Burkholderia stagnalis]
MTIQGYFSDASNQPLITFADGTTWDYTAVTNNLVFMDTSAGGQVLHALYGVNNRIVGAAGDAIYAGDRNDTITVGKNSTVFGGSGVDTLLVNAGSGKVILNEMYANKIGDKNQDVVKLGAGILASATRITREQSNNLVLDLGNGDSLTVVGYFGLASYRPVITFANGTTWDYTAVTNNLVFADTSAGGNTLRGLSGVDNRIVGAAGDTIYAGDRNDTITVGKNNTVFGGSGVDTLLVNAGSGKVILNEMYANKIGDKNQDVVKLGAGILASATRITREQSNDLVLDLGNGDSLTVVGYFGLASYRPVITFANGTTWDYTAVTNNLVFADTSAGGNTLRGLSGVDNRIVGAAGDTIYAGDRNDTITVGKNNTVYGGSGVDTFIVNPGTGATTLYEGTKTGGSNQDVLQLNGVNSSQLWFSLKGNDLEIDTLGTTDHVTIHNWASSSSNHVSQIRTADAVMTSVDPTVAQLVQAMAAFGAPPPAQTAYTPDEQKSLAPLLASSWHRT